MAWRFVACAALAALAIGTGAERAHAEDAERLSFERALGLAHELPELVAMRQVARDERAIRLPRPWQPLEVLVTPQARIAPRSSRGIEGVLSIQQAIPLAGVNAARRSVLERQADARSARAAAMTLEARLAVASAWIAAWRARERRVTAEREYELASSIVSVTERGVRAGVFTAPELADAKAYLAEADVRRTDAEGEVTHEGFELARATARTGALLADGPLPVIPLPPATSHAQLVARARAMPAVTAKLVAARASRARAAEERATRRASLIVGAEIFRDEPGGLAVGLTAGIALPHDRGQREARQHELEAQLAEAEATQLVARGISELESALHEVQHTGEVLAKLRDVLVPAAEEAAARRQRAVEVGESTIVELLAARRTALLARARLTDAEAAHVWARIEAWLLLEATGGSS